MKFWAGVTDNDWFNYLSTRNADEVNFWQPTPKPPFTSAPVGMPFLFKLKKPNHDIAGGGFFVAYSRLPVALAWDIFGEKNGADSLAEFQALLEPLSPRRKITDEIGCTVLSNAFYLPRNRWLHDPPGWFSNVVRGRFYESTEPDGALIWGAVSANFFDMSTADAVIAPSIGEPMERYGEPLLVRPRLGQSSFRVMVTEAYKRRCAITGESTLVTLEAAHILPFAREGQHEVRNGLLLRADFHRLFDVGLVAVTPELRVRVSPRIREAWSNGRVYYRLNDQPLAVLPDRPADRPDRDLLEWHLNNCYQG
ncbi:MAG: HNH endonuclease [Thermoanaerobaculia bacterium]